MAALMEADSTCEGLACCLFLAVSFFPTAFVSCRVSVSLCTCYDEINRDQQRSIEQIYSHADSLILLLYLSLAVSASSWLSASGCVSVSHYVAALMCPVKQGLILATSLMR